MKYIDGFRDPQAARALTERIHEAAEKLSLDRRPARLMEVCGTHTMAIARHGIHHLLPDSVRMISGPGCPVCVTDAGYIDAALQLAERGVIIATFGDMLRVPGSQGSLAEARSRGAKVVICLSPDLAVDLALSHPQSEVVFLAIGFETTVAPVISVIEIAHEKKVKNFSLLTAFKQVPPALDALVQDPDVQVQGFLCPAHVSAIIGANAYRPLVEKQRIPCVVAGFEPLDILYGIWHLISQLADGRAELVNTYERVVKPEGNRRAQGVIARLLVAADASWRGIGVIPGSGLAIRSEYADLDAALRFGVSTDGGKTHGGCRCGDVLKGKIRPSECKLFGVACRPEQPIGACMVSSEGSCAAHYRYLR